MISGGWILRNAVAICEMTKTSGNLKRNEDLESFKDVLCSGSVFFWKKIFWLLRLRIGQVRCIRNISQKTECERSSDKPKKKRICFFPWQMVQPNYQGKTTNSLNPLWDGNPTVTRENLSAESQGGREKFRPEEQEDDAEDQEYFWSIQGYFSYCHHVEPKNFNLRAKKRIISCWTKLLRVEM